SSTPTASTCWPAAGWWSRGATKSSCGAVVRSATSPPARSYDSTPRARGGPMRKVLFLFGQLSDEDVQWMLAHGSKREVAAGEVLIRQGVPVDALFILLTGHLAVLLGPQEREIARLNAGEIVGEMSFVDARPPSATVRAIEDATVFALSRIRLT